LEHLKQGRLTEAVAALGAALEHQPQDVEVRHNYAVALARHGRFEEAIGHLREVVRLNPQAVDAHGNLALACWQAGQHESAVAAYRRVAELRPDAAEPHHQLANALRHQGRHAEAIAGYRRVLELQADHADAWHNLGLAQAQNRQGNDAVASYREALRLRPDFPEAHNNLGIVLEEQGKLDEAVASFRESLRLKPDAPETLSNLGVALAGQGKHQEALACYYEALRIQPDSAEAHNNLGNALRAEGLVEESIAHHRRALEIKPGYAEAHNNLGIAFVQQGDFDQALAAYTRAVDLKPEYADAHMNRSLGWLALGDFARGWPEYEWRWRGRSMSPRPFPQPPWDGSPLGERTILLHAEQGLGDTLQFVRYARLVQARGARVVVEAPRPLLPLLQRCRGIDRLVGQGDKLPDFDVHAPLLSLPGLLGTTLTTVPAAVPYLEADPALAAQWRQELARLPGFKVGVAWQGSAKYKGDRFRSVPLRHFAPLARVPGVRLIPLQKGPGLEQKATAGVPLTELGRPLDEAAGPFMDTAAVLQSLDLFITSDSAIAHLAGALGMPAWLVLPHSPDWRWLRQREDSPWYPTMRLFRQQRRGDWDDVFLRVADELARVVRRDRPAWGVVPGDPAEAERLHQEAVAHIRRGQLNEAVELFRKAVDRHPGFAAAHHNLGVALAKQQKLAEAIASFQRCLHLDHDSVDAHGNVGLAYLQHGELEQAMHHLLRALELRPYTAETLNNLGVALVQFGKPAEAVEAYQKAIMVKPDYADAHANLARALLIQGQWAEGWREYEWRWQSGEATPRAFRQPRWDGSPLEGRTLLLHAEQGLGDTVHFVRYAALAKARGGRVVAVVPPPLVALLGGCAGIDRLMAHGEALPDFDVEAPLMSLPGILGTTLDNVPAQVPYLHADPALVEQWRQELTALGGLKVGVAWQGNPGYSGDNLRSIPLRCLAPLADVPGVRLIALQHGAGREQMAHAGVRFTELSRPLDTTAGPFQDTAAVLRQLDVLVTSDSAIAHVAGALGVRTLLALPFAPDWRWLRDREDSPWYPSMRLFRQQRRGDWDDVARRIAAELAGLAPATADPGNADQARHWYEQGLALLRSDQAEEAAAALRQALQLAPGAAEVLHNLGVACARQGQVEQAIEHFTQALAARPGAVEALGNLGLALLQAGRAEEAVRRFREALRIKPEAPEHLNNLGVALGQVERLEEALPCYREALRLKAGYADAHNNLGNALRQLGATEEARQHCEEARRLRPDLAEARNNLGIVLEDLGQAEDALASYQQALRLKPDYAEARLNRALCWLGGGQFEKGWPEYEWRWRGRSLAPRLFPQPRWDGKPLDGRTILLHAEQGLGDTLQFARYAPVVKLRGGQVLLEAPRPLLPLLARLKGVDRLVGQGNKLPDFDVHAPLLSLPGLLGTTLTTVPAAVPYLEADPALATQWRQELARLPGFKVGVAWQGSAKYKGDRFRSVPLRHFAPLARVPGVRLLPLQKGQGLEQKATAGVPLTELGRPLDEGAGAFMDSAAVLKSLDLFITSDSVIAHLAGALGVPVWLVLPFAPDWRWLRQREDSPWYPTMRLFRQQRRGDWEGVFQQVAGELARHVSQRSTGTAADVERAARLIQEGKCEEALPLFDRILAGNPQAADVLHNLGVALAKLGRLADAVVSFQRVLQLQPDSADALGNLGLAYLQLNKPAEAIPCLRKALEFRSEVAETHNNLGVALNRQNQTEEAIRSYQEALRLRPDYADAGNNLGNALRAQDRMDEAIACYRQALAHHPGSADLHNNLGIALSHHNRLAEAVPCFHEALRLRPEFAEAANNLGVTLADLSRLQEAVAAFDQALRLRPDHAETRRNRALALLLLGDYERGWTEYEWRWKCDNAPRRPFAQPAWDGAPLEGRTILLHAEQGLGDTLHFIRYAPLVQQRGGRVVVECQPALKRLLGACRGIDQLVVQGEPLPAFDVHAPLLSLPTLFRTTPATVPADAPYLTADPALVEYWRQRLQPIPAFKVGIAWQGSSKYGGDKARSIPLKHFAALAAVPGVQLVSLQKGSGSEQLAHVQGQFTVLDLGRQIDDAAGAFMDSAAVMHHLDLVISSDTALPHLAGALGVPVWVALCCPCDWRWLREREDSPWYPSMRLFRQRGWGDWDDVFERLAAALAATVAGRRPPVEVAVPVAPGELLDKLTILEIKLRRIGDAAKLKNVQLEHDALAEVWRRALPDRPELTVLRAELTAANEDLWRIEDEIRDCERAKDFGPRFVELARSVYVTNDRRAAVKRRVNDLLGSRLVEEKSYAKYD
jgi:tetratricopeptide (TPR) repeat protein